MINEIQNCWASDSCVLCHGIFSELFAWLVYSICFYVIFCSSQC